MNIAYVRVSTEEQNEERQVEGLKKHQIEKWFVEKVSSKDTDRPQLQAMLDYAREGVNVVIRRHSFVIINCRLVVSHSAEAEGNQTVPICVKITSSNYHIHLMDEHLSIPRHLHQITVT